jgi:hypothetical protein
MRVANANGISKTCVSDGRAAVADIVYVVSL